MSKGNTICKTSSLDWYTNAVGETPCQTYQRLRQICNAAYTVGTLSTDTPGDRCDDQLASCCCNSVSFALSMLCLNCQQGVGTGVNGDTGYDAGVGAYQIYLGSCSPKTNQSLPNDIQAAVCNQNIKIDDSLYGLFWHDGSWYYIYTRETMQKNEQANANNVYTHCGSTTNNITTSGILATSTSAVTLPTANTIASTASSGSLVFLNKTTTTLVGATKSGTIIGDVTAITSTSPTASDGSVITVPNTTNSPLRTGIISGIAVGGVVAAILFVGFVFWLLRRWRRDEKSQPLDHVHQPEMQQAPFTSFKFPSNGTSAASTSRPALVPSHSNSHLFANSRNMKRRQTANAMESARVENDNNLSTTHLPPGAASVSNLSQPSLPDAQLFSEEEGQERHADGGPLLERSPSGRLPPAYEDRGVTAVGRA